MSNQRGELQCVGSGDAIRRAKSEQLAEQRERLCGREGMTRWQGEVVEGCHGPRAGGVARAPRGGSWGVPGGVAASPLLAAVKTSRSGVPGTGWKGT